MHRGVAVRDDKGGLWFAWRGESGERRVMHAPGGKRFWHEGEEGFREADLKQVTDIMVAEGFQVSDLVNVDDLWSPPPAPEEDPKLERIIRRLLAGAAWEDSGAGVLSTSESIAVALATGMHDELPPRYHDPSDAWERLDGIQQAIVRRHVPDEDAEYLREPQPHAI